MAIPKAALVWSEPMDPTDVLDYQIDISPLLEGNTLASYTLVPGIEAELLGLKIGTGQYVPSIKDNIITLWLSIDPAQQGSVTYNAGANLPVVLTLTTSSTPARTRQRTAVVKVINL